LILNVANGIASGSLNLQNIATYPIGGTVTGQHVSLNISSAGTIVGTIIAKLDSRDKHVTGAITNTLNGQVFSAHAVLNRNSTTPGSSSTQTSAPILAPGFTPNLSAPPITSGLTNPTNPGTSVGIGDAGGGSSVLGDPGSVLGD